MPKLMEKKDWPHMVSSLGEHSRFWQADVFGDSGIVSLPLPEFGTYHVFLVKVEDNNSNAEHSMHVMREFRENGKRFGSGIEMKRIKVGSMKDEIRLPENFDQLFEDLDEHVSSIFNGAVS